MNELRTIFNRMKSADFHRNIRICESICHGKLVNGVMGIYDLSKNRVIHVYQKNDEQNASCNPRATESASVKLLKIEGG